MGRFNLIGGSYRSQSPTADLQRTLNWYPEVIESQDGKSGMALYPTPGTSVFCTFATPGPVRALIEINGLCFAIVGTSFIQLFANGLTTTIGVVANDGLPASMVASPQQLLIAAGGNLYLYQLQGTQSSVNGFLKAGTFQQIPNSTFTLPGGANGQPSQVEYIDGFFLVLLRNSQTFYISTALDASSWPGTQQITVTVFSDNIQGFMQNQRRLQVLGRKRSTTYYDSGSLNIFDVDPSGTVENGMASVFGLCRLDNSIFWIDQDERGQGVIRRNSGYTPVRVSNHAVEFALQSYPTISDCVAYPYQDQGHSFAVFCFPTASKTWVYDVATQLWHERAYWNEGTGQFTAHKSQCHVLFAGKHLVGDPTSANIYQMAIPSQTGAAWNFVTDNGNPIIRERISPWISKENHWLYHNELVVDVETGLGPEPPLRDGSGNPRGPELNVSWTKDWTGHTWSNQYALDCGQAGMYRTRARRSRLGRDRARAYKIKCSDPIGWRIIDAYLMADDYAPKQRLISQYGQAA